MQIPIKYLLASEINKGLINQERLEEKIAAFLELVNKEIKAFDVKSGEKRRLSFDDAVQVSFNRNGEKIPILIISPRFINGSYVASNIVYGKYINNKPYFMNNGR